MRTNITLLAVWPLLASATLIAGPLDPDCTAEKAAKSAAMKATVGVGGRCSTKEAASDTAKRKTGMEQDREEKDEKRLRDRDRDRD